MILILISWLLTLLTLVIWLRALHGIPIYTHTPLQGDSQRLQLQTLMRITQLLLLPALALLLLHFTLPQDSTQRATLTAQLHKNVSTHSKNSSDYLHTHNLSMYLSP